MTGPSKYMRMDFFIHCNTFRGVMQVNRLVKRGSYETGISGRGRQMAAGGGVRAGEIAQWACACAL